MDFVKYKKQIRVICTIVLLISAVLLGLYSGTHESFSEKKALVILVLIYLVLAIVINSIWAKQLNQKVSAVVDILERDQDPDRYLREMERLTGTLKSVTGLQLYYINMAVGYMGKDDYETALQYMQQVPSVPGGPNRAIYWMDLAYCYFHLERIDEAMEIMRGQKEVFQELEQNTEKDHIRCLLYELFIFENVHAGNRDQAMEYYEKALPLWEKRNRDKDRAYMSQVIQGAS